MSSNGRRILLLLALFSVLPLLGAYLVYRFWQPVQRVNQGELIAVPALPSTQLSDLAGKTFSSDGLRGKWLLVTIQPPACAQSCQRSIYYLRQVRLTQGKNAARIERLWLLSGAGAPDPRLLAEHPGLLVARAQDPAWLAGFPAKGDQAGHIYLIDPLGNIVLRYESDADPKGIVKDLTRLLNVSRIG